MAIGAGADDDAVLAHGAQYNLKLQTYKMIRRISTF